MKKISKTTLIGALLLLSIAAGIVALLTKHATLSELGSFLGIVIGLLASLGFKFSADERNDPPAPTAV